MQLFVFTIICFIAGFLFDTADSFKHHSYVVKSKILSSISAVGIQPHRFVSQLKMSSRDEETNEAGYTQKQLLREETEAPFRNVRIYLYLALLSAAGLGGFISIVKVIAALSRGDAGDMSEMYQNVAINLGGIPVLAYLWKREIDSRNTRLERIQRGGSLAALKLKTVVLDEPIVVKLADLRRNRGIEKRVVLVCAKKDLLRSSMQTSVSQSQSLVMNDLLIVPLVIDQSTAEIANGDYSLSAPTMESMFSSTAVNEEVSLTEKGGTSEVPVKQETLPAAEDLAHIGLPVLINEWNNVIKKELQIALKQQPDALDKGITIVIKKNGKVGTRRFGVPIWEALVGDVESRADMGLDVRNI